jgi:hypothetical protein
MMEFFSDIEEPYSVKTLRLHCIEDWELEDSTKAVR